MESPPIEARAVVFTLWEFLSTTDGVAKPGIRHAERKIYRAVKLAIGRVRCFTV
jgi:hypothetical protein